MGWFFFFFTFGIHCFGKISALYLTWHDDPTSTMDIHWHAPKQDREEELFLLQGDEWKGVSGEKTPLKYLYVHTTYLKDLNPDTEYAFRIGKDPKIYSFRTAPKDLKNKIKFVIGGDADQTRSLFQKMNETIVKKDPLFCVIGGDIAYAVTPKLNFEADTFNQWMSFLSIWKKQMITNGGRVIPLIVLPGNHDILDKNAELYKTLFPSYKKSLYRSLTFSNYLNLIMLDTGYIDTIESQSSFLEETLIKNEETRYCFAIYHEGAYPSHYPFEGKIPTEIREYWCPLFDKYGLTAAFENHNHTYKKTHPLRNGKVDSNGIIYFGDGCWGSRPRPPQDHWYLSEKRRENNVYLLELSEKNAHIEAINIEGEGIDTTILLPR